MNLIIPQLNFAAILPELIVFGTAVVVLVMELFTPEGEKDHLAYISLLGILLALFASLALWGGDSPDFQGMLVADDFSLFFNCIFLIAAALGILVAVDYIKQEGIDHGEYYVLILFATTGMMLMAASTNLIIIYMGLEILSLPLYILAAFEQRLLKSIEAGLKYFLLGAFASAFFLYGTALIYGATGTTDLTALAAHLSGQGGAHPGAMLLVGAGLLVVGFGYKVGVAPFHMWMPDVYEGAPTSVTAFMSVGAKPGGFAAFLRTFIFALPSLEPDWQFLLAVLAVLTMIIGVVVALAQTNIKRMLGYSGVAHAGFILVGLVAGNTLGAAAVLFYLLAFTFTNFGAFAVIIALERRENKRLELKDYSGLGYRYPVLGAALSLFMLSLAGFPATAGFLAKFHVISAAVQAGLVPLAVVGVLCSVIAAFLYIRVIAYMYMRPEVEEPMTARLSLTLGAALLFSTWGTLHLGLLPSAVLEWAMRSVATLLGTG